MGVLSSPHVMWSGINDVVYIENEPDVVKLEFDSLVATLPLK